jgi:hypothetical protein
MPESFILKVKLEGKVSSMIPIAPVSVKKFGRVEKQFYGRNNSRLKGGSRRDSDGHKLQEEAVEAIKKPLL